MPCRHLHSNPHFPPPCCQPVIATITRSRDGGRLSALNYIRDLATVPGNFLLDFLSISPPPPHLKPRHSQHAGVTLDPGSYCLYDPHNHPDNVAKSIRQAFSPKSHIIRICRRAQDLRPSAGSRRHWA